MDIKAKWSNSSYVNKQIPVLKCFHNRWNINNKTKILWIFTSRLTLYNGKLVGEVPLLVVGDVLQLSPVNQNVCLWKQLRDHKDHSIDGCAKNSIYMNWFNLFKRAGARFCLFLLYGLRGHQMNDSQQTHDIVPTSIRRL